MRMLMSVSLILMTCCSTTQDEDPLSVVRAYLTAQENRDMDAAIATCDPEVVFTITGVFQRKGIEEMRKLIEWDFAINGRLKLDNFEVEGSTVTCSGNEKNDWFAAVGIDEVIYDRIAFSVEGGKITSITADAASGTSSQMSAVMARLMPWLQERHPEMMDKLFQDSEFIYSAENALRWRALLKEWNEGKDAQEVQ